MGAQLELRILQRKWDDGTVRRAFRIGFAAEALAIAAILAGAELRAVRIGVGARRVRRRPRERMIAVVARGGREDLAREDRRERRQRIVARARRFERIAALSDLAVDVAGLAGDGGGIFEFVVVGLKLGVADAPVLDRHVGRNE